MSQIEVQTSKHKTMATRTVVLLLVIVGLSASAAAFAFASASANPTTQNATGTTNNLNNFSGQWPGVHPGGSRSFTSFRAGSTVANVSVTGFNIVDSNHLTISLSYHGTGTTPAITIVAIAPGLSGSNTAASGWTSPSTVSIDLVGTGSLSSSSNCIRVLVVPLTGA